MEIRATLLGAFAILMTIAGATARPATAQMWTVPPPDSTAGNGFGGAVAISGDRLVVGATGLDACGPDSGAAFVYVRDEATGDWTLEARLIADDCEPGRFFGREVAISGDRVVVSAHQPYFAAERTGHAYLFERDPNSGAWFLAAHLAPAIPYREGAFGMAVDIDGDRAVVTSGGDTAQRAFGGAAHIFERSADGEWQHSARLLPSAGPFAGIFGGSASLDGDRLAVSAPAYEKGGTGSVYVFECADSGDWHQTSHVRDRYGFNIPVSLSHDLLLIGEPDAPPSRSGRAVTMRLRPDGEWHQEAVLVPNNPYDLGSFGTSVSLSGPRALVSGYDEQIGLSYNIDRVVYVFDSRSPEGWRQATRYDRGRPSFGTAVDVDGRYAVIGQADDFTPGAVYVARLF